MKLPIQTLGLMAAGLLIGTALSPVAAQSQQSGADGQVALRSDGALYLIQNGQRRWIATAVLEDSAINAIPEGEPIMTGLAMAGSAEAQAKPGTAAQAAPPAASQPAASGATAAQKPAAAAPAAAAATQAPTPKPTADTGEQLSPELSIQIDLDGATTITQGDERKVEIRAKKDVTCELFLRLSNGKEQAEDSKNANSDGKCAYTIEIPGDAPEGSATIVGTIREGGKMNRQELPINVKKK
jgi:hypothetical protein